jgi:hypothetical protein
MKYFEEIEYFISESANQLQIDPESIGLVSGDSEKLGGLVSRFELDYKKALAVMPKDDNDVIAGLIQLAGEQHEFFVETWSHIPGQMPKYFIFLNTSRKLFDVLNTLAHELCHVCQLEYEFDGREVEQYQVHTSKYWFLACNQMGLIDVLKGNTLPRTGGFTSELIKKFL